MGIDDNGTLLAVRSRSSDAASLGRVLTVYLRRHIAIGPEEARLWCTSLSHLRPERAKFGRIVDSIIMIGGTEAY